MTVILTASVSKSTVTNLWSEIYEDRAVKADRINIHAHLVLASLAGIYLAYLSFVSTIYYETFLFLAGIASLGFGILFVNYSSTRRLRRILGTLFDSILVTLYLFALSRYRNPDFLLYSHFFMIYFIIMIFTAFRRDPLLPLISGVANIAGFLILLYYLNPYSYTEIYRGFFIFNDVFIPKQQLTKTIFILLGSSALMFINFYQKKDTEKSIKILIDKMELDRDLELASDVQKNLLPADKDILPLKLTYRYKSARVVGGDFFELVKTSENKTTLLIADVAGHGVASALMATMLKVLILEANINDLEKPGALLNYLDETISNRYPSHHLTAQVFCFDTENQKVLYASAGHPPALFLPKNSKPFFGESKGSLLGFSLYKQTESDIEYTFEPEDRLVTYTDGIIETLNNNEIHYGTGRLLNVVKHYRNAEADSLCQNIINDVSSFSREEIPEDDIALVLIDYTV